ncbi:relaxase/mobilization nuclease domain-containing protein [Mucilaginibacter sp. SMC90]|uniref:relaxase/mobilization nuclease domain-containing protein n=1 Tax=Mucilaginibacter sp. SMC90 TaxID=2929803 RepID=UPI001FB1A251|nr:relaxase/mobilization nuclease domain-containing protein [Mucilaginibacter sp. SMC90]UOE48688.1 relaxase/mobilization nuclease domain-containing protein [Mucilaginibacter sp. SMC90]
MVAKIKSGKSLINALNYNENKVRKGHARFIGASGYAKDLEKLSFHDKLLRLTDLASRNQLTKTNALHVSLNFSPGEKLDVPALNAIADRYMQKIGFGDQPYLIYRHEDAGHPHIHILATNIQPDGRRISMHNIGKQRSEPARKAIEIEFGLVQAEGQQQVVSLEKEAALKPLSYGEDETKKALSGVVSRVIRDYKFTSLPEFNAILGSFNVLADRGSKASVMYQQNGLRYWVTDSRGAKMGVPVKASALPKKPTIRLLEKRFQLNELLRRPFREQLKSKIDQASFPSDSLSRFEKELHQKNIRVIIRKNTEGRVYGLTFIDEVNKVVFNGSDLGKKYSAAAIIQQFGDQQRAANTLQAGHGQLWHIKEVGDSSHVGQGKTLLEELLSATAQQETVPYPLRKKKKRRHLNL